MESPIFKILMYKRRRVGGIEKQGFALKSRNSIFQPLVLLVLL